MNNQLQSELLSCINSYPKDTLAIACDNISDFNLNSNLKGINITSNVKFIKLIPKNSQYNYQLFNNDSELELASVIDKRADSYSPDNETNDSENSDNISSNNTIAYKEVPSETITYTRNHHNKSDLIEISLMIGVMIAILGLGLKFAFNNIIIFVNKNDVLVSSMVFLLLLLSLISYCFIDDGNGSSSNLYNKYLIFILITLSFLITLIYSFYVSYMSNRNLFYAIISLITKTVIGAIALILTLRFILIIIDLLMNRSRNFDHHIIRKESFYASGIVLGGVYWFISKLIEEDEDDEEDEYNEEYDDEDYEDEYEEIDNKKHLK